MGQQPAPGCFMHQTSRKSGVQSNCKAMSFGCSARSTCCQDLLPTLNPIPCGAGGSTQQGRDRRAQPITGFRDPSSDGKGAPGGVTVPGRAPTPLGLAEPVRDPTSAETGAGLTSRHVLRGGGWQQRQGQGGAELERRCHGGTERGGPEPRGAGAAAYVGPSAGEGRGQFLPPRPWRPPEDGARGASGDRGAGWRRRKNRGARGRPVRWLEELPARLSLPAKRAESPPGLPESTEAGNRPPPPAQPRARPQEGARPPREEELPAGGCGGTCPPEKPSGFG